MSNLPDWMIRWYEDSLRLYNAPISDKSKNILPLDSSDYIDYDALPSYSELNLLCATVKLNGGLGTSMGCQGPKSLIKIDSLGNTFLDRIINQFQENDYSSDLILLNSFNTTKETNLFLNQNYSDLRWSELIQHPFKKVDLLTGAPFLDDSESSFNPPGHGSVFFDLYYSGILDDLLNRGVDYLFISNSDNLAANLDDKIMSYLQHTQCPFLIELTPKTVADVKGGTVVRSDGHLMLWEIAQVLDQQRSLFESQPVFNTNNIWVSVKHLMDSIQSGSLSLDLIRNKKSTSGAAYVQLEYAMGSAIKSFPNAKAMIVPRSRFFPIKKTNDLLLLLSDYCNWTSDGQLVWDDTLNVDVELSAPFDTVAGFFQYFHKIPSIKSARSIRIQGPIIFDQKVRLFDHVNLLLNSNLSSSISSFFNDFQNVELISD